MVITNWTYKFCRETIQPITGPSWFQQDDELDTLSVGWILWCSTWSHLHLVSEWPVQALSTPHFWTSFLLTYTRDNKSQPKHLCSCLSHGKPGWTSWFLGFAWSSPSYCKHLGNEPVDKRYIPLPLSPLFLSLSPLSIPPSVSLCLSSK